MTSTPTDQDLIIKEQACFAVGDIEVKARAYLGLLTAGVHYFKVQLQSNNSDAAEDREQFGLLRVGSVDSSLSRELKLRETLGDYALVAKLLEQVTVESVLVNPPEVDPQSTVENAHATTDSLGDEDDQVASNMASEATDSSDIADHQEQSGTEPELKVTDELPSDDCNEPVELEPEDDSDYLAEEYYPEKEISSDQSQQKLLLLSTFPAENETLATWLQAKHSREEYLSIAIQVCQFSSYLYQRKWYLVDLLPQLMQIGKPLKFFDLTTAYSIDEPPDFGLIGNYCAPELAAGQGLEESIASYAIAALLYECFHQKALPAEQKLNLKINPIPRIYQLLKIGLSPIADERFPLSQLLSLLVETRNLFRVKKIQWQVASYSTVGLSTSRLTNEDNYGVRQQQLSDSENLIMAVVADGMGGMAQGEVASQVAVKTLLEEPIPQEFNTVESRASWLLNLFQKANASIANQVKDGGTTLSAVLGICDRLMVAHVGDSRIYHIRQGEIIQLSEDHSMVAMMVASGQITQKESLEHPDRNVLTKSLGSKRRLSDGYVQDLKRTRQELSMTMEDGDILLLCSDGVWDLVSNHEIAEIFTDFSSLQSAVDATVQQVLERGASDNATLLALQCIVEKGN